ncbi:unnamed protein product [Ilex paraguariensis]|uniref:Uncharacterized protein n=1 Tax=Ilex paraguariensis TaxID=185542 RepID=A0ABC8SZE0_9AQUA
MADGTKNDADFAEQDMIEKNKEENQKITAAIEQFDSDKKSFKKNLNESSSKFDFLFELSSDDGSDLDLENSENAEDYVKENLKKKSLQENQGTIATAEFTDQDRNNKVEDEIPAKNSKLSPIVETLDQKIPQFKRLARGLKELCNDDDSDEEEEEVWRKILGLNVDTELDDLDEKSKDTDQFNNVTQPDYYTNIEGLEEELYELMREFKEDDEKEEQGRLNKLNVEQKVLNRPEDSIECVDFAEIDGLEFDKSKEEFKEKEEDATKGDLDQNQKVELDQNQKMDLDQESEILELIFNQIGELETRIPRLQDERARLKREEDEVDAKFQLLKLELAKLKQRNSDMEMDVFELVKNRIKAIMEQPADHELREKVKSWLESQTEKVEAKMESTETQI